MSQCARPGCSQLGKNKCSSCLREPYCSGDCQKGDWKVHKTICKTLVKLSLQLQSNNEIVRVINEIRVVTVAMKKRQQDVRLLGHLISYVEHQFGDRIPGKSYRERGNGERIQNWTVEIDFLCNIYNNLICIYETDESLSMISSDNLRFPINVKMLDLMKPWCAYLNLNSTASRNENLSKDQIDGLLLLLTQTERNIAAVHMHRNKFDQAENHCQKAISYARQYDGKEVEKGELLSKSLTIYSAVLTQQRKFEESVTIAEEAYNCVAIVYDPVHPKVQEAASVLIESLLHNGNLYDAERFAQAALDSLKDPKNRLDQQSEEVAQGYYNFANVLCQLKGDLVKAEMLGRESLRITTRLYGNNHQNVGYTSSLLGRILKAQNKLGRETKELFERSLAIDTESFGPDGTNTAVSVVNLANFYGQCADAQKTTETRKEQLLLSKSKFVEAVRIYQKILGPNHPTTIGLSSNVSMISNRLSEILR